MLDVNKLRGIFPPILTPLTPEGRVDGASVKRLVNWLIEEGVHGIWALGTTGEFAALDGTQRETALVATLEAVNGRVPVVANVSDGGTALAIGHARTAQRAGADAIAVTPPYYYQHSMDEMLDHYRAVRQEVDLPLLVYNIPQTVKVKMEVGTVLTLAEEGTVVGIKDSQNDLLWFRDLTMGASKRGLNLRAFLGTRTLIDAAVQIGGIGSIPSIANVAPRITVDCHEAAERGDYVQAAKIQEMVVPFERLAAVARGGCPTSANLASMKSYLKQRGLLAHSGMSLPLRGLTVEEEQRLAELARDLPELTLSR